MKWLKISLGVIIVLVLLLSLTIIAITQWVDPNQYKIQISQLVEQNLNRQLTITGEIQLSFFPWLGLKLGATKLNNPKEFEQQPFAAIQQAQVKVKLLPLLFSQQVQIGQIKLDGLQLSLIQTANGSNNWQDLTQTNDTDTPNQQNSYFKKLEIDGLQLNNSFITFIDEQQQTSYTLQNLNLQTSAIGLDQDIQIKLDTLINTSGATASVALQTEITPNINQLLFKNTQSTIHAEQLPDKLQLELATGKLDLIQQTLSIPQITAEILKTTLIAQLQVDNLLTTPSLTGKISFRQEQLDQIVKQLPFKTAQADLNLHATMQQVVFNNINAQFDQYPIQIPTVKIDLAQQNIVVDKLNLQAFDTILQLSELKLQNIINPDFSAKLQLSNFNLKKWVTLLKLPEQKTVDKTALTQIDLRANIKGDLQRIQLQNIQIKLDQTQIKGQIELSQFDNPLISLSLEADNLDADRYLPPSEESKQKPLQPLLPLELLKALNVKGNIKLKKLTITQMQLRDINLQFKD